MGAQVPVWVTILVAAIAAVAGMVVGLIGHLVSRKNAHEAHQLAFMTAANAHQLTVNA